MYIRLHSTKDYGNTGTCKSLVEYLEKENISEELNYNESFFNYSGEISSFDLMNRIDNNVAKLEKDAAKFFMVSINPSSDELKFLAEKSCGRKVTDITQLNRTEKLLFENELKLYTNKVMDIYAQNFNKGLKAENLVYGAKIEHQRKYNRFDKQVEEKIKKAGDLKEGWQSHIHVIVSRKDESNKIKISPFSNHKNSKNKLNGKEVQIGFNRKEFVTKCEKEFDDSFQYKRELYNSFQYRYTRKNLASKIGRSYARQFASIIPGAKEALKVNSIINSFNSKDPLRIMSSLPMDKDVQKLLSTVYKAAQPQRLIIDLAKKLPGIIDKASTIKL